MTDEHPNVSLIARLDLNDLDAAEDILAEDFVWHFVNPKLPDIAGAYKGLRGLQDFFAAMKARTNGSFQVNPISATPVGDELVVVQTQNSMTLEEQQITIDVVLVWRIVDGRLSEVWDIPSVHTLVKATEQA